MGKTELLTRGKLARLGGVNIATVRYYEKCGLLCNPPRTLSGYRLYAEDSVRRLHFIKQAKRLGFSLEEIQDLLSLSKQSSASCNEVRSRAKTKINNVNQKIDELRRIKGALESLADACHGKGETNACPILEALDMDNRK